MSNKIQFDAGVVDKYDGQDKQDLSAIVVSVFKWLRKNTIVFF